MPEITRISVQKRRPNRRSVFLDGAFAFGCNVNVIARFRLREGMRLTPEQVGRIQLEAVKQECFDDAIRALARRLHSRAELRRKLVRKEYGETAVDAVLADLVRLGYVNDERFARTRALSAARHKHHGRRRARIELLKAGVTGDVAERALSDVYAEHDGTAVARDLAQKQASRLRKLDPMVARRRLVGMLHRRGFDYESIRPVVEEVLSGGAVSRIEDRR